MTVIAHIAGAPVEELMVLVTYAGSGGPWSAVQAWLSARRVGARDPDRRRHP